MIEALILSAYALFELNPSGLRFFRIFDLLVFTIWVLFVYLGCLRNFHNSKGSQVVSTILQVSRAKFREYICGLNAEEVSDERFEALPQDTAFAGSTSGSLFGLIPSAVNALR
jgi:hypothetical protein